MRGFKFFILIYFCCIIFSQDLYAQESITIKAKAYGHLAVILVDKQALQNTLPSDLSLQPVEGVSNNLHPVVVYTGLQLKMKSSINGLPPVHVEKQFEEVSFKVVNVKNKNFSGLFNYMTAKRLNSIEAINLDWWYRLPSELGLLSINAKVASVWNGTKLLYNSRNQKVDKYDKTALYNNLQIFNTFNQPLITKQIDDYKCISTTWDWDKAKIYPATMDITVNKDFGNVVAGKYSVDSIDESAIGAFKVYTEWNMGTTETCK